MTRGERWGWRVLRGLAVGLGGAWAMGLMWVGCELGSLPNGALSVATLEVRVGPWAPWLAWSAGLFVWMFLVSDDLCPRGSRRIGGPAKAAAVLVFFGALVAEVARWVW